MLPAAMIVLCGNCRAELGELISREGQTFAKLGGVLLYSAHGFCASCNTPWHYFPARIDKHKGERKMV